MEMGNTRFGGAAVAAVVIWIGLAVVGIQICSAEIKRRDFPEGFVFGAASSAYQYEGAAKQGGRGQSIWDKFSHTFGKILDFSNGDVTANQYQYYKEDVSLIKDMGLDSYRFSISWSRIFPKGTGEINQEGVNYYSNLIDALLSKGIQPYVTLYHWDLPQALEDKYHGWLDPQIIKDFAHYANTCFELFGDRVQNWITLNEPHTFAIQGYDDGIHAPGRCSLLHHIYCKAGNSSTEPYIVGHHALLAHAAVVNIYRKKYKQTQKGSIGMSFDVIWFEPATNSFENKEAAKRAQDFQFGWFMEPIFFGDYPKSMRERAKERLPKFTTSEEALVKGSLDFVGINHYTTYFASKDPFDLVHKIMKDVITDSGTITIPFRNGKAIGDKASSIWLYIVPEGIRSLMNYIKDKYGNPIVIITENGMDDSNSPFISIKKALNDTKRINYHKDYLKNLLYSIREDGCNVRGYFAWSLLDNWEWTAGFTSRFGLYFVDYKHNQKRYPKESVAWFKNFLSAS